MRASIVSAGLVVLLLVTACEQSPPGPGGSTVAKKVGHGKLTGNTYAHDHFGISITFPEDWYVASEEEKAELMEMGTDVVAGGDQDKRDSYEAAKHRSMNLVSAFELPPGTPVAGFNPNIIAMAESVKGLPGIKSGREYIQQLKLGMANTALRATFGEIEDAKLGSRSVHRVRSTMTINGMKVSQTYYATRVGDYALSFILSYGNDEQLARLTDILDAMKFDAP